MRFSGSRDSTTAFCATGTIPRVTPAPRWQAALDTLYGFANFETRPPGRRDEYRLDRMWALLADLGNPQAAWPAVHVGGTNGKGSTCAYIASMLQASGYRVGLFTSPHLHTVRERIQVDGRMISQEFVREWLAAHQVTLAAHDGLTTFEALTALASSAFAAWGVDIAVVEVGLGGQLDTTRVVQPHVTVLCPIDLDHTEILGDTVAAIASDKAGIIAGGVPVVTAAQQPEAMEPIAAAARASGSSLHVVGTDSVWSERWTPDGRVMDMELPMIVRRGRAPTGRTSTLTFPRRLPGTYQAANLATAAAAAWALRGKGWDIPEGAVIGGAAIANWPARFHQLPRGPQSPSGVTVLIDGAHNPAGARALAESLKDEPAGGATHLILGLSRDKDLAGIVDGLQPITDRAVATSSRHPRAMPAAEVLEALEARAIPASMRLDPAEALEAALADAMPGDVVVAAGSLFVAAAVREAWLARSGLPLPERDGPPHG
jgi:dihydrofolate synthase/folylpolyglutamate synthase